MYRKQLCESKNSIILALTGAEIEVAEDHPLAFRRQHVGAEVWGQFLLSLWGKSRQGQLLVWGSF
jgi:hypothetical protein